MLLYIRSEIILASLFKNRIKMRKLSEVSTAINEQIKTDAQIDELVGRLAQYCIDEINKEVIPNDSNPGGDAAPYARQSALEKLIALLNKSV